MFKATAEPSIGSVDGSATPKLSKQSLKWHRSRSHFASLLCKCFFFFSSKLQLKLRNGGGGGGEGLGVVVTFSQPSFSAFLFSCTINQELTSSVYFVPNHSLKC